MFISTKAVGRFAREDVTDQYKHKDSKFQFSIFEVNNHTKTFSCFLSLDSAEEREVVLKALRQCENLYSRFYLNEALEDVRFDFQLRDDIVIGSPFK